MGGSVCQQQTMSASKKRRLDLLDHSGPGLVQSLLRLRGLNQLKMGQLLTTMLPAIIQAIF